MGCRRLDNVILPAEESAWQSVVSRACPAITGKGDLMPALSLLLLLWLPSTALAGSGQPRLPQSSIPADASDEAKGNLLRLYAPTADKRAPAIAALGNLAEKAAPAVPFSIGITDSSSTEGKEIRQTLVKIGAAAVEPLLPALHDPDRQVRTAAAWVLGELKDPRAVAAVAELLHDEERLVREAAAKALGEIGAASAIGPLFTTLHDKEVSLRQYAAKSLGKIGGPEACRFLVASLHDRFDRPGFSLEIRTLAEAIDRAKCLPSEELLDRLRNFGRNLWTAETLQHSAL